MKTKTTAHIIAVISALTISVLSSVGLNAGTVENNNTLIYNNRAFVHAIQDAPNPAGDKTVQNAEIIYVDKAYGQAIYSYPSNIPLQHTAFNVEYVDTAYGQAIYSYPNNNVKHRMKLVDNALNSESRFIVPVSSRAVNVPVSTAATFH